MNQTQTLGSWKCDPSPLGEQNRFTVHCHKPAVAPPEGLSSNEIDDKRTILISNIMKKDVDKENPFSV